MIGCPALTLWVSIDTPDVDLECDLYEIQPDGTSIALRSDLRIEQGAHAAEDDARQVHVGDLQALLQLGAMHLPLSGIDPTGAFAVVEIRDINSRQTVGAKVFDVAKRTFDDLDLKLPSK